MKPIRQLLQYKTTTDLRNIISLDEVLYENQLQTNQKYFRIDKRKVWSYGYDHVPLRRWLFSYRRLPPTYELPIEILINHTHEHLYKSPLLNNTYMTEWTTKISPAVWPTEHLPGSAYKLTWQDYLFSGFLRYMFASYFHRFAPRIHQLARLLAEHWSSYLLDKNRGQLNNMAAIQIRRTDKMIEDRFWKKHGYWRNISMYVKPIVDEERRRNRTFSCVFVMSDDVSVLKVMRDYSNPGSLGTDEPYARKHLKNRKIIFNIFAPEAWMNAYGRVGTDQFLVSVQFIIQYAQFVVSHTDSNIGRFFGRNHL